MINLDDSLAYDIEQLWIEGLDPVAIADQLDCHINLVESWLVREGLRDAGWSSVPSSSEIPWDHYSDLPSPVHYDPYATINS